MNRKSDKYWIPSVSRTIDILDCFQIGSEQLTVSEIGRRTAVPHATAYRILHTLVARGYLVQNGLKYSLNRSRRRLKLGFANLSRHVSLAIEIQHSLELAALAAGVELRAWDNNRNPDAAIRNAEEMVNDNIDIGVEFQLFEHVAPVVADIFSRAHIPLISVVNPHHGTLYFGVNNYRAGFTAGIALAEHARSHWRGVPDALLLLESRQAGRSVQSRLVGAQRGVEERLGPLGDKRVHHLDGDGDRLTSRVVVEQFLRSRSARENILIATVNDESAIGALDAVQQNDSLHVAIVSHGGSAEMVETVADSRSACIGTVSFRAALYGPDLIAFALATLQGGAAPAAHYIPHEFVGKDLAAQRLAQTTETRIS